MRGGELVYVLALQDYVGSGDGLTRKRGPGRGNYQQQSSRFGYLPIKWWNRFWLKKVPDQFLQVRIDTGLFLRRPLGIAG